MIHDGGSLQMFDQVSLASLAQPRKNIYFAIFNIHLDFQCKYKYRHILDLAQYLYQVKF